MMPSEALFTPIFVRVLANHVQVLWLRFGTARYGFRKSGLFNSLRRQFVPVRFRQPRYGTVHPSIGGCTRTTPMPPDPTGAPGRGSPRRLKTLRDGSSRGGAGYTIGAGSVVAGARQ